MGLYARILVTLDGSPVDDALLDDVERLADALGSTVLLLRVAHYHTRDSKIAEEDEARADLQRASAYLSGHGFSVETVLGHGEPGEVIVEQARELHADLISMATHGHGWLERRVLGSVADFVRHHSDVPLLLVKGHAADAEE
jgi:nucleotide-binding universal stress UspA family protein